MSDYKIFVVPYDFSAHARAALVAATDLAKRLGADLHLLHVIEPPAHAYGYGGMGGAGVWAAMEVVETREGVLSSLRDVVDENRDFPGKIELHAITGSSIAGTICEFAERLGADLIVMGTHGRTGLAHAFLGSVAERTQRSAPCPVLTLQAPEEEQDD